MHILLVEDDPLIVKSVQRMLYKTAYNLDVASDGQECLKFLSAGTYEVILMDIMLPGQSGLTTIEEARQMGIETPILCLTGKGQVDDIVAGLESGGDDYLVKPYNNNVLLAKIRALSRRACRQRKTVLFYNGLKLDVVARRVTREGQVIFLSDKEYELLEFFMRRQGQTLDKDAIKISLWPESLKKGFVETNILQVYISYLRHKLAPGAPYKYIQTVNRRGYRFGVS
ncbi:MAG: response regulator transcription factor [Thermodesulfobacteriota bacterium]|nr:response regulator transcription factor [Thermodesulfobacteriota bacterium]